MRRGMVSRRLHCSWTGTLMQSSKALAWGETVLKGQPHLASEEEYRTLSGWTGPPWQRVLPLGIALRISLSLTCAGLLVSAWRELAAGSLTARSCITFMFSEISSWQGVTLTRTQAAGVQEPGTSSLMLRQPR